jgi:hypothetical protein
LRFLRGDILGVVSWITTGKCSKCIPHEEKVKRNQCIGCVKYRIDKEKEAIENGVRENSNKLHKHIRDSKT